MHGCVESGSKLIHRYHCLEPMWAMFFNGPVQLWLCEEYGLLGTLVFCEVVAVLPLCRTLPLVALS